MNATAQDRHEYAVQLRWLAHTMAEILVILWAGFLVAEYIRPDTTKWLKWPVDLFVQGAILTVVFAGYAVGWRKEMLGGWMAILGTATFAALLAFTQNWPQQPFQVVQVALFAAPGVLYLMARRYDRCLPQPSA
jgi:hypothetical protein